MWDLLNMANLSQSTLPQLGEFLAGTAVSAATDYKSVLGVDLSIESLRSQQYSNYIFGFLVLSLIIFSFIIFLYMPKKKGRLKKGEVVMVGAIIMGVVIALLFGWLQLIEGYLV